MEVPNGNNNKGLICFYEAFGTGLILYTVNISAVGNKEPPTVAFAIMCIVIILSPVCGCHFNGAVTLGVLFKDSGNFKQNLVSAIQIITSQIIGGTIGVFLISLTINKSLSIHENIAVMQPMKNATYFKVFLIEAFGTFAFVTFVLYTKYHASNSSGTLLCFVALVALYTILVLTIPLSGGCINPSLGIVQTIFQYIVESSYENS